MKDNDSEKYPRILIIDDDPSILRVLRRLLEFEGFEVADAENGRRGLVLADEIVFDLVITDILMPDVDGLEVIQALMKKDPKQKIIAISGEGIFSGEDCLSWAAKIGAIKTFAKPFNLREMLASIYELLGIKQGLDSFVKY